MKNYNKVKKNNDANNPFHDLVPALSAFEVTLNGHLLWSKLDHKAFPDPHDIFTRIKKILSAIKDGRDFEIYLYDSYKLYKALKTISKYHLTKAAHNKIMLKGSLLCRHKVVESIPSEKEKEVFQTDVVVINKTNQHGFWRD